MPRLTWCFAFIVSLFGTLWPDYWVTLSSLARAPGLSNHRADNCFPAKAQCSSLASTWSPCALRKARTSSISSPPPPPPPPPHVFVFILTLLLNPFCSEVLINNYQISLSHVSHKDLRLITVRLSLCMCVSLSLCSKWSITWLQSPAFDLLTKQRY